MSSGPLWMFAPIGAVVLLPALIELQPLAARAVAQRGAGRFGRPVRCWPWGAVALTPAYSEDRQAAVHHRICLGSDARQGRWAVNNDGAPVPFAAAWERTEMPLLAAQALGRAGAGDSGHGAGGGAGRPAAGRRAAGGCACGCAPNGAESVTLVAPADADLRRGRHRRLHAAVRDRQPRGPLFRPLRRAQLRRRRARHRRRPCAVRSSSPSSARGPACRRSRRRSFGARPALARPQYAPDSTITLSEASALGASVLLPASEARGRGPRTWWRGMRHVPSTVFQADLPPHRLLRQGG